MTPERLRAYVLIFMRDVLIAGAGVFTAVYLLLSNALQPFHLPLIAGMLGVPLVARGNSAPPKDSAAPPSAEPEETT